MLWTAPPPASRCAKLWRDLMAPRTSANGTKQTPPTSAQRVRYRGHSRHQVACNCQLPAISLSFSFDQRRRPDAFLTAIATAFFWPTRTTRRLPAGRQVGSTNLRIATTEDMRLLLSPRQLRHSDQLVQRQCQRHSLCDQPLQDIGRQIAQPHHPADEPI